MRAPAQVWAFVADGIARDERVVLLTVVAATANSPGRAGFALVVDPLGRSVGTIGGGAMELRLVDEHAAQLREGQSPAALRLLSHVVSPRRGEPSGLICGGSQTVTVHTLGRDDLPVVEAIRAALAERRPAALELTPGRVAFLDGIPHSYGTRSGPRGPDWRPGAEWRFTDRIGPDLTVLVIGGGHVGAALAGVLTTLDLEVLVVDERENVAMGHGAAPGRGAAPRYRTAVGPMPDLRRHVVDPEGTYAVVMTSSVTTDTLAVRALLPLGLPFVGVMGTARKRAEILERLDADEREAFRGQGVHAPVGIAIGSHTPEEIAISVAAQIVAFRNGVTTS